jgi:hypothetical protein
MVLLFARVCGSGNWDSVNSETPEDLTFPADVLADVLDHVNEVSVWQIDNPPGIELEILAAAIQPPHAGTLSDKTFRIISDWKIDQLGLKMRQTAGDSLDSRLKGKHNIIQVNTAGEAIKLAKAFKDRPEKSFSQVDVMRRFAKSVQERHISTKRITPELWSKLIGGEYLQLSTKEEPQAPT